MDNKNILDVQNLKMYFSSGRGRNKMVVKAVDDISFQIKEGETFGLVGESGCGKTTAAKSIIRLYNPTDGKIIFKDKVISGKLDKDRREHLTNNMQMIFQDPMASLNPRMTIEEIISEGLIVQGLKDRSERLNKVYEALNIVGLARDHISRYPHEFSGGQRQRVGVARAIVTNPALIIADEPVSALDVSIQAQVINLFNNLIEEFNITFMFIAHDLSVVKYFSDRIGVMYYGKLVEIAEAQDLYKNPIHPYTQSLLSSIPQPDPYFELNRKRIIYNPTQHDYTIDKPSYHEISKNHFVYCSDIEAEKYIKEYVDN